MMNWSGRLRAGNSDGLRDRRNRWRRTVGFLLGALLWGGISLGAFSGPAEAAGEISVLVFGEKLDFDVPPVMDNGRLLVPTRYIGEALRAEVTYDAASRTRCVLETAFYAGRGPGKLSASGPPPRRSADKHHYNVFE